MAYFDAYEGPWTENEAAHLMRRAGFGGRPEEINELTQLGMADAVDSLVDYEPVDETLEEKIRNLRNFEDHQNIKNPEDDKHLQGWWLYRMVHTTQPLQEQFTLFLHDHFVSEWDKVRNGVPSRVNDGTDGSDGRARCTNGTLPADEDRRNKITARMMKDQNDLLRTEGHGNFQDMLLKITRDPAMLIYLDNDQNQKDRPQENYAREIMELFSMGVDNYTEEDVREVAKALTGETVNKTCAADYPFSYFFHVPNHSREEKIVFGVPFNELGRGKDTERVIELIAHQVSRSGISPAYDRLPATSLYMSWKFLTWFVHEEIPMDHPAVEELAEHFYYDAPNGYIYDVRECLRMIFRSQFFYDTQYRFAMFKNPADFMVMSLRLLDVTESDYTETARAYLTNMGMRLFSPPDVNGWIQGRSWINSANLLTRFNYANRLSTAGIINIRVAQNLISDGYVADEDDHDGLIEYYRSRLLQQPLNDDEIGVFREFLNGINRGQDQFRRKAAGLAHLMLTSPKYQVK